MSLKAQSLGLTCVRIIQNTGLLSEHLEALKRSGLNLHRGEKPFLKDKLKTGESKYLKLRMTVSERYEERNIRKTKFVARLPKPTKKKQRHEGQGDSTKNMETVTQEFDISPWSMYKEQSFSWPQWSPKSFLLLNNSPGIMKSVLSDPILSVMGSAQASPLEPSLWTARALWLWYWEQK